ncbi:hypothetical protein BC628DRAFT_166202 [Trametes gibbosa]|nr:hypothetical protein BC628DRAFT_166202 [Trametes gibbosa]
MLGGLWQCGVQVPTTFRVPAAGSQTTSCQLHAWRAAACDVTRTLRLEFNDCLSRLRIPRAGARAAAAQCTLRSLAIAPGRQDPALTQAKFAQATFFLVAAAPKHTSRARRTPQSGSPSLTEGPRQSPAFCGPIGMSVRCKRLWSYGLRCSPDDDGVRDAEAHAGLDDRCADVLVRMGAAIAWINY